MLKALFEATWRKVPPKTHNLVYLSSEVSLEFPEHLLGAMETLNGLSIVTRYPEDLDELVRSFRKKRVEEYLKRTKELLRWLKRDERLKIISRYKKSLETLGISVSQIILYGSYAKNRARESSDIDVAVVSPDFKNFDLFNARNF